MDLLSGTITKVMLVCCYLDGTFCFKFPLIGVFLRMCFCKGICEMLFQAGI